MQLDLWTSAFCAPCAAARRVSGEAAALVPGLRVTERDVAAHPDTAEDLGIRSTPTIIVRRDDGAEVFRSPGVPSRDQLLVAVAKAL
ncbi:MULTISPECIES: co-chaperone YbbN [unclassified Curtobacterium]|uniref:thioredoxin family protein n=1 Tax=unclassified Curtobacterium TaxID=257496 RepID=UPI00082F36E2|nr:MULTISPECIES: thioredoxin family protein [unclassified Curtobacterium]MBP1300892.1 thioredoxin 1 [Curtobacterium sp. 1310]MCM3520753.1 thioredoxin family protein [Curtobacterium sp. P97]MDB6426367.1 thioredoxin family protein [Curtobacterium sp. 20TX0008]MDP9735799.1 thioredoxin 1 [Curtobacterium sp. 260]MDT0210693.1 thioredoxin family protein [Curtobacterium sp. BRD11]